MKISAVLIAKNEEDNIPDAIRSVAFADEILVIDSGSTDKTIEISESLGAKVLQNKWQGFSIQKQFAVDNASNDWILSLDADERVSEKLKNEILELKNDTKNDLADGYKIPRLNFYMDRPIRFGGWYPDWQLRFFDRSKGNWKNVLIHESFQMRSETKIGKLKNDILHYSIKDAAAHHRMIGERYAPLAAREMFEKGKRTSKTKIATVGFTTFWHNYLVKGGFLDGFPGFCIARFAAHHSFMKHLILFELQNKKTG